jgi:hypothetical protein
MRWFIAWCGMCGKETEHEGFLVCKNCGNNLIEEVNDE